MQNRAARMLLFCLFIAAIGVASFLFWRGQAHIQSETAQLSAADDAARQAARSLLEARASQQAYVAAGQGLDYWAGKASQHFNAARAEIATLHASASSSQVLSTLEAAGSKINDLGRVDKRAVEHVRNGQRLLASDLVFTDGLELNDAALASLEEARLGETLARQNAIDTFRQRQAFALIAGAAASMLTALLLLPSGRREESAVVVERTPVPRAVAPPQPEQSFDSDFDREGWKREAPAETELPVAADVAPQPTVAPTPEPVALVQQDVAAVPETIAPAVATTDIPGLALLCVDLARLSDTRTLPSLLDRAASILDASGIILWIADPDGRELNPIFAQGYPQQLINRLGTIPRDAENATAAAFRTSLLQTVRADQVSPGAIAAPLVTSGGCVGVMAAEVRHDSERHEMMLAAATIVAAQLATLVGPPSARSHASKTG
jgi:hypothetical protein